MLHFTGRVGRAATVGALCVAVTASLAVADTKVLLCTGDYGMWAQDRATLIKEAVGKVAGSNVLFEVEQSFNFVKKLEAPGYAERFDAIVCGDIALGQMTTRAQQALVRFVNSGGGLIYVVWAKSHVPFDGPREAEPLLLADVLPYKFPSNDPLKDARDDAEAMRHTDPLFQGLDFSKTPLLAPGKDGKGPAPVPPLALERAQGKGKLMALYGLKWNQFSPDLPVEALLATARVNDFCWRIEQILVREGGFALITGGPGTGKSVTLRIMAERLATLPDLTVGAICHPRASMSEFYSEMGAVFGVALKPHNRFGGFQALRERWQAHIGATLLRPVLILDEAQEMSATVLSELRLLTSTRFDSRIILTVVLAGDGRLVDRLGGEELLPLGSRIRTRLAMEYASKEELGACLKHLLHSAGNAKLMTSELMNTLCEHAMGNFRALTNMGAELLAAAAQREIPTLDEKLYLEVFAATRRQNPSAVSARTTPRRR